MNLFLSRLAMRTAEGGTSRRRDTPELSDSIMGRERASIASRNGPVSASLLAYKSPGAAPFLVVASRSDYQIPKWYKDAFAMVY